MPIKNLSIEEQFKEVFGFELPDALPSICHTCGAADYDGDIPVLTMPDKIKYFPKFDENEHFSCSDLLKVYIKDVLTQFIEEVRVDGVYICTQSTYHKTKISFNGKLAFKSKRIQTKPGFDLYFDFVNTNGSCVFKLNTISHNLELNHAERYEFAFPDEMKGDLTKMPTEYESEPEEESKPEFTEHPIPCLYSSKKFESLDDLNDFIYKKLAEFVDESFNNDYIVTVSDDYLDGVIYLEKIEDSKDSYQIAFEYELFPNDVILNIYRLEFPDDTLHVKSWVGCKFTVKDTQSGNFTFIRLLANDIAPVCDGESEDNHNEWSIDILKDLAGVPRDSHFTISELNEKIKSNVANSLKKDPQLHPFKVSSQKYGFVKEDLINHPNHYQTSSGLEARTVINAFTEDLKGRECNDTANVLRYMLRWHKKNGLQDLEKARNYLNDLIEYVEKKQNN